MQNLKSLIVAVAIATAALTGCQAPQGLATVLPAPIADSVAMNAMLNITGPSGYHVLTLTAWNKADIDHVNLTLLKDDGSGAYVATGATKVIANAALGTAVTLGNLKLASNYKVVARAYSDAAGAVEIDNMAESGSDADCRTFFTTPSLVASGTGDNVDDTARTVTLPLRLMNKTFAGQANAGSGVAVTNGTIVSTTATETF